MPLPTIVLASQSPNRRELFSRLQIPFEVVPAHIDETQLPHETPEQMVMRLAQEKAEKVAQEFDNALVIGSDEVVVLNNKVAGKPITFEKAQQQLSIASGNLVTFFTGLCLLNTKTGNRQQSVEKYQLKFRQLSESQIVNYLQKEKPYECAGSIKVESLGVALCEKFIGDDPAGLIGLPLIRLVEMLMIEGVDVLSA